jgi:DNA polymerase
MTGFRTVQVSSDHSTWIRLALSLLDQNISADHILWSDASDQPSLPGLDTSAEPPVRERLHFTVPRSFINAARHVLVHRDAVKWPLLYRILWRLRHDNRHLMQIESDPDVHLLRRLERQVRTDTYRMTQFVRFRKISADHGEHFVAWHRPDHDVLELAAPFFVTRFAGLRWSILTPYRSAHWNQARLYFGRGVPERDAPRPDELEQLWRTYYAAVFNPARINPKAMSAQMPARFWASLPEAGEIAPALARAAARVATMVHDQQEQDTAAPFVPETHDLSVLENAARSCRGCELCLSTTQTVFGRGRSDARIMLIGEQPGDEEDLRGIPFVGPAGQLLDQALREARLDRRSLYLTNAVKHFRFTPAGRARKHQTPRPAHVVACRPWLEAELRVIGPSMVICLGATAARALFGYSVRVMHQRGHILKPGWAQSAMITVHPSAVLRAHTAEAGRTLYRYLVSDLAYALRHVQQTVPSSVPGIPLANPT